jgi:hypothetical protein
MRIPNTKLVILVALLAVWALLVVFRHPNTIPVPPKHPGSGRSPAGKPLAQEEGLPRLKLELLRTSRGTYPPEAQDIFGSPPAPTAVASLGPGAPAPAAPPGPPPPDPFQEAMKQLRYVGYLQDGQRVLAFIVQGPQVHIVGVGDTFSGRFHVQAIQGDAVLLSSLGGDKQARLPLAGRAATPPPRP